MLRVLTIGLLLCLAASARAAEPVATAQACEVDLLDAGAGTDLEKWTERVTRQGFRVAHTGKPGFAHQTLQIFHTPACAERAKALGKALKAQAEDVQPATWKLRHGVTVVLPASGSDSLAKGSSKYGKFELAYSESDDSCQLKFRRPAGPATGLLTVTPCSPGKNEPKAQQVSTSRAGEEFHVFAVATAGGGNACTGSTFYAVVVDAQKAWATEELGFCTELESATLVEGDGKARLSLVTQGDRYKEALRYEVAMGSLTKHQVPRKVVSSRKAVLKGEFGSTTNWYMVVNEQQIEIDAGDCDLRSLALGLKVTMWVDQQTWDDGNGATVCLKVEASKAGK
ncbi:MAG: hypothetical protein QM765_36835 [Myxococcales bacterium]